MINKIMYWSIILISISSCNRNVELQNDLDSIPFVIKCEELKHVKGQGVDSQIGTVICDDISLTYDYGLYSNNKPLSMLEAFSKSFYAYHYSKFFDAVFVDEKLREPFKDSVKIVDVVTGIFDEKYIVECDQCNATAYLLFNGITFLYPLVNDSQAVQNHRLYDIDRTESKGYYKKTYLSKKDQVSGVYIAPLGKPQKSRRLNKLSVSTNHLPDARLVEVLESVRLK